MLEKARLSVLVALQIGRPVAYELVRKPPVEVARATRALVPLPYTRLPSATEVSPVPPFDTARVPEMSAKVEVAPLYTLPAESTPRPPAERAVSQVLPEFEKAVVEA